MTESVANVSTLLRNLDSFLVPITLEFMFESALIVTELSTFHRFQQVSAPGLSSTSDLNTSL